MLTQNRNLQFWVLQTSGWVGYAFLTYLIGIEVNEQPGDYLIPCLLYAAGGVIITCGLRWLFRTIWDWHAAGIVFIGGIGALAASIGFTGYRSLVHVWYYGAFHWADLTFVDYFNLWDLTFSLYVIGTWSGLYFGIRFYRTAQAQKERLLRAQSMAHEAQLKMLRYQLNPHFLFNTLNAISTLVLEEENDTADQMLTRLSAFLRHSLHSDPMQKVTLQTELEALRLYLSIEQVRFDEFLTVEFDIDEPASSALVPSLLMQPLIENAIKHAIAVNEQGGTIGIAASLEDGKLCLRVTDTGPGAEGGEPARSKTPSGIGLRNIRERLLVLYGTEQDIDMKPLDPSGLAVTIRIPIEYENDTESDSAHRR